METKRTDGAWRKDKQRERDNRRLLAQQGPDRNRKIPPCVRTVMAHLDSSAWALHHFPLFFLMSWLRPSLSLSLFLAKQQQRDDSRREKKKKPRAGASLKRFVSSSSRPFPATAHCAHCPFFLSIRRPAVYTPLLSSGCSKLPFL